MSCRACLSLVLLFPCVCPPARAADEKPAKPRVLEIRPTAHDAWGNNTERVRAVLLSTADTLYAYFPDREFKPILVEPLKGPITLFDRGPRGEYYVRLDTGDNLWAQWAYQFAHEFGHILSSYDEVSHQNKWFEETVCEVSSLFALRKLSETWAKPPSPDSWQRFAPNMRKYAQARIDKAQLPAGVTLAKWFKDNSRSLSKNGYDRDKNTLVAVQLLPLFEKTPEHWEAITWLAKAKKGHAESFPDFLKAWQAHCPEKHRPFVAAVAQQFGIALEPVK